MKNLIITTVLLLTWGGLFSQQTESLSINQENDIYKSSNNKSVNPEDLVDTLVSWCNTVHVPGMSVCILKNGDVFWDLNYGYANIAQLKQVSDSTCFILCSTSKLFVQTAIMQQYEQGYFELEDDINDSLPNPIINPEFPFNPITYFQLMTHTSSINYGFPNLYQYMVWGEDPTIPLGDFIEGLLIPGGPYYFEEIWDSINPPGTQWDYGNIGHCLLGHLTECISGQTLENYMQDNIFSPLGINNASYFLSGMDTSYLAVPYNWEYFNGSWQYKPYLQPGAPFYPSAFLKMSALDLAKFLGMYMKHGTYNGNNLLEPETVELITTPNEGSLYNTPYGQMCLTWMYLEDQDLTYWGGGWNPIASSGIAYDKDDDWGIVFLLNTRLDGTQHFELQTIIADFAKDYEPFIIDHISLTETDGDQVIEANEVFSLGFTIQNYMNFPEILENATATISANNPFISLVGDSVYNLGTANYLDEILIPEDQFVFEVDEGLEPGNVEFQLSLSWDDGVGYTIPFDLFAGHADVLLVRDEESENNTEDWYLQSLDSLGYSTNYYDLGIRDDLTSEFINTFPAVIWFTGIDTENTLSVEDQSLLMDYLDNGYLDNGGRLFLSGQNISDELEGTIFLEDYLYVEHLEDTWTGQETIDGVGNDPIGNGLSFQVNQGDGLANQYSMSVVEPIGNGYKVFGYHPSGEGAAIRFDNNIYKSVFFAFGFEAINGFENRKEILFRILNDYFQVIVETEEYLMSDSRDNELEIFPNPFSSSANLRFTIEDQQYVICDLYEISGIRIKQLLNEIKMPGTYEMEIDMSNLPKGIYFCVLKTPQTTETKKIIKLD